MAILSLGNKGIAASSGTLCRMKILEATEELTRNIPLAELTVKEICENAGVSRQTFYNHFGDKFEIPQWYWSELGECYLKETGRTLSWYESNLIMIEKLSKYPHLFFSMNATDEEYYATKAYGFRNRVKYLKETITDYRGIELTDDLIFQIEFFVYAESQMLYLWAKNGMKLPSEVLAARIDKCIPRELNELLAL